MREKLFDIFEELLLEEYSLMSYDKKRSYAVLDGGIYLRDFFNTFIDKIEEKIK